MKGKSAIVISVLFGILASTFVWLYLSARERELLKLSDMRPAVLAAQDLLPGRAIEETMLAETLVPRAFLQPGTYGAVRDVVGQIPAVPIPQGAQVSGTAMTGVGRSLATKIPRGKRAVSIAVTDVSGVSGLIRPANFVDILAIVKTGTELGSVDQDTFVVSLFQNVLVLAVGKDTGDIRAGELPPDEQEALELLAGRQRERIRSVTVALTPQQAQDLALAQEAGDLSLTLRSYLERDASVSVRDSTAENVFGVKRVVPRRVPSWQEIRGTSIQ